MELKEDIFKYLYLNFEKVQKILYDSENIISLDFLSGKFILSNYFYLSLLITYSPNIINFEYSIDIIQKINNQKIEEDKIFKEILKSKIVLDLIYNYKQTDIYDKEKEQDILNKIENSFLNKINNNKLDKSYYILNNIIFLEMDNNNNYKPIKIDNIYIKIIKSLIEGKKLGNSSKIIEQLDFESIILTKEMLNELIKILNDNNDFIKDFLIIKIEDLLDEKKINFYYILFKYILKNSYYIYKIPFLFKTRVNILKIIKVNIEQLKSFDISKDLKDKIVYLLEIITDSKYYIFKYINCIKDKLVEIESKKEDIISIENLNNKNINLDYKKSLNDFNEIKKENNKNSPENIIKNSQIDSTNINSIIEKTDNLINQLIESNNNENNLNQKGNNKIITRSMQSSSSLNLTNI